MKNRILFSAYTVFWKQVLHKDGNKVSLVTLQSSHLKLYFKAVDLLDF